MHLWNNGALRDSLVAHGKTEDVLFWLLRSRMGNTSTQGNYAFYWVLPKVLKATESCDVIMNFPFPLTQRLKISNDITKENGIYLDSIRNLLLPFMSLVQKCKNLSKQGVCHCDDRLWVTPSLMKFKPAKRKNTQFRLNKKKIYWILSPTTFFLRRKII